MKKLIFLFALVALFSVSTVKSYAQLSDEEYNYVTMDLRGILNLTMTTNPQVDFVFKTIQEYQLGITKFNATLLEVDATLAWDLFAYASTDDWEQVEKYSNNGADDLPAEILQLRSNYNQNRFVGGINFNDWASLLGGDAAGNNTSGVIGNVPALATTQFLGGAVNAVPGAPAAFESMDPGTAANNPTTNKFRIDMRLKPQIPATFGATLAAANAANGLSTIELQGYGTNGAAENFAAAGYYYIEIVYSLIEDL